MYYDISNKKVLGKKKDEFNGTKISEFIGLKSKMYSLVSDDFKEVNKTKRINKKLKHKEYHNVLFNNMKRIQSKLYKIGTYDVSKILLSCFDDKRCVLDNEINSLPNFNKDIVSSLKKL